MNYTKALRAAHILHKFCNRRKCENCLFHDTESRATCRINTIPIYYHLEEIDKKMYKQMNKEDIAPKVRDEA